MKRAFTLFGIFAALLLWAHTSKAQYTKLFDFTGNSGLYPGYGSGSAALLSDGVFFYGMTSKGGTGGIGNIFKIKISDGSYTNIHDFNSSECAKPFGSLVSDGTYLYGTASTGGAYNNGTVFKIKIDDNSLTKLYDFGGSDGHLPTGTLTIADGFLYGMTEYGGDYNKGTAFKIKIADNSFTKLHDFNDADGYYPHGSLISDGTFLYGMAPNGGNWYSGGIFKIKIDDGSFMVMHNFSGPDGRYPSGTLMSDGKYLYGMTPSGGLFGFGNIFKIKMDDDSFTTLNDFNQTDGMTPQGSLISDGIYLYGMSENGGKNQMGNLFKLKIADNSITTLHEFNGTDGALPDGSLIIQGADLYGMTPYGGASEVPGGGVVFKYQYAAAQPDVNGIIYVDSAAAPGGDGSSWANAVSDLSEALQYARTYAANWAGDSLRIYVAKGTYMPEYRADDSTLAINDRNDAFVMVKNVHIYGGFPSGGGVRNWAANPTILSGDIGTANEASDNAYHVVISTGDVGNALLDGFTVTGGNATGSGTITVNGHTAQVIAGGGVYTIASDLRLNYVKISGNAAQSGGGIYIDASNPNIINALITGNSASSTGGGIRVYNSNLPIFSNVTVTGNTASYGGAVANAGSTMVAYNSIFFANSAATGKNIYTSTITGGGVFEFCLIEGSNGWDLNWGYNYGNSIVRPDNPFVDTAKGNYQLVVSSLAINAGSNQHYTDAGGSLADDKDITGSTRVYHQTSGGVIDMGAYEFQDNPVRPDSGGVMYVDSSATNGGDGSSWATALPQLSDALKTAEEINNSNEGTVRQIWIAKGTYYPLYYPEYAPTLGMTDRDKTFMLVNNVAVYGGFKGTEASAQDRSVLTGSGTILSGDISELGNKADNAYHVVSAVDVGVSTSYILAYVTITGGNANGTATALIKGRNVFRNQGGGMEAYHANIRLNNCLLIDNSAEQGAAIMAAYGEVSSQIVNCSFSSNTDNDGKAIFSYQPAGALRIRNSIVMNGIRYNGQAPLVVSSLVQGMAASSIDHLLDGNSDPQFIDAAGGDYHLAANSPAINAGDNSLINSAFDLDNNTRIYDPANGGFVDLGAYEFQGAAALPVKMSPLSGALGKDNQVMLTWHTYTEINNKGFQIQYGIDGTHFENGLLEPSKAEGGNSTAPLDYTVNVGVLTGVKYYRLKQIDLDGDTTYSNIIRIAGSNNGFRLKAYPNPTHNLINIHLYGVSSPKGQVIIMDLSGREVKRQDIRGDDSKIDLSGLSAGVYVLKYDDGVHNSNLKFIKK